MASFLDPNDPRLKGGAGGLPTMGVDPIPTGGGGDWFSQQGAPTGGVRPNAGGLQPNYIGTGTGDAGGWNGQLTPQGAPTGGGYTGPDIAGGGYTGGAAGGGADTSWWNPADPKGSINALFGGQPPSSQTILAHAPQLQAAGIQISPPNADGVTSKINIPGVGWTRILDGGEKGGQGTGWNYVPQGVGGGSAGGTGMSPLGAFAGGLDPSAAGRLGYNGGLGLNVDVTQDPSYQFRVQQGQQALERSAAAKGTLLTGGTAKALARYGQDLASTEYGNVYNRALGENQAAYGRLFGEQQNRNNQLMGLAGLGATAASAQGNLGSTYAGQAGTLLGSQATNIGNNLTGAGNANAASTLAQGNAWQQGLQGVGQGANNALQMYYLSRLYGGGGGGGGSTFNPSTPGTPLTGPYIAPATPLVY